MKVAVLGSGGREHAMVWKLCRHRDSEDVFFLPGNAASDQNVAINTTNFNELKRFCQEKKIEVLLVGPEAPLAAGIVESFQGSGIHVFGPGKEGARLESSKIWAKEFMEKHGVATADFWSFKKSNDARELVEELDGDFVIKYDGLAAGKGVFVCSTVEEALTALHVLRANYGEKFPFLVERKLHGQELSLLGFTDGKCVKLCSPSQDHKRAYDNDLGPNTGGMGAFCPVPFWDAALEARITEEIITPTVLGLQKEQIPFCGVLYFGVMLTEEGPRLLEYNVRFGDPEAQVVLPALQNDMLDVVLACLDGRLEDVELAFHPGVFVDVVLCSGGYPGSYSTGFPIEGLEDLEKDTLLFHAGTKGQGKEVLTNGGRVLSIVSRGKDRDEALGKVYAECEKIHFEGAFYRKDIGRCLTLV